MAYMQKKTITPRDFAGRVKFHVRDGVLHGSVMVRLHNGQLAKIVKAVPLDQEAHEEAAEVVDEENAVVGLSFGELMGGSGSGGGLSSLGSSAVNVTKSLYSATKTATSAALKITSDPKVQAVIASSVPGGSAIVIGTKAANLVGSAINGDRDSINQIADIAAQAAGGSPAAQAARDALKAVFATGASKGVFQPKSIAAYPSKSAATYGKPSTGTSTVSTKSGGHYGVAIAAGLGGLALLAALA